MQSASISNPCDEVLLGNCFFVKVVVPQTVAEEMRRFYRLWKSAGEVRAHLRKWFQSSAHFTHIAATGHYLENFDLSKDPAWVSVLIDFGGSVPSDEHMMYLKLKYDASTRCHPLR